MSVSSCPAAWLWFSNASCRRLTSRPPSHDITGSPVTHHCFLQEDQWFFQQDSVSWVLLTRHSLRYAICKPVWKRPGRGPHISSTHISSSPDESCVKLRRENTIGQTWACVLPFFERRCYNINIAVEGSPEGWDRQLLDKDGQWDQSRYFKDLFYIKQVTNINSISMFFI